MPSQPDKDTMLRECLQSPILQKSVTFQRFLVLRERIAAKIARGESTASECVEAEALLAAVQSEMTLEATPQKPQ